LAFVTAGKLRKIDVTGGPPVTVCDVPAVRGGSWSPSGVILLGQNTGGLLSVPAVGGTPTLVTAIDTSRESAHRYPWFLPDGHRFLYVARGVDLTNSAVFLADLQAPEPIKPGRSILPSESNAMYLPPGYLLFTRERTLMAQPFDAGTAVLSGEAVPIAEQIEFEPGNNRGAFSVSRTGVLTYQTGNSSGSSQLTWFDRTGKAVGTVGPPGEIVWASLSPDERIRPSRSADVVSGCVALQPRERHQPKSDLRSERQFLSALVS
jgi:hypothetical protein